MDAEPVIAAPMRLEGRALVRGLAAKHRQQVTVTGVGRRRSLRAARSQRLRGAAAVAVAGIAGGIDASLSPGDIVVASQVRDLSGRAPVVRCPAAPLLAAELNAAGLPVRTGPVGSAGHVVGDRERRRLAGTGLLAVDMESAWLARSDRPAVVLRVVADIAGEPLLRPATLARVRTALRTLAQAAAGLQHWVDAVGPRTAVLAGQPPRGAGAERGMAAVADESVLREVATVSDLVLVLGAAATSDGQRMVEVSRRSGTPAYLVGDVSQVCVGWLAGVSTVGIATQESAPAALVDELLAALAGLGPLDVQRPAPTAESVRFTLPKEVRPA